MTKESRQFVSLDEIVSIQLRCGKANCGTTVSVLPDAWEKLPDRCPSCGKLWWEQVTPSQTDSTQEVIRYFQRCIRILADRQTERLKPNGPKPDYLSLGCDFSLEIKAD